MPPRRTQVPLISRDLDELRDELEREYLTRLFFETGGDPRRMAARLGIGRTKLYRWYRKLAMDIRALRKGLR